MDVGDWLCGVGLGLGPGLSATGRTTSTYEVLADVLTDSDLTNLAFRLGTASACSRRSQAWVRPKPLRNRSHRIASSSCGRRRAPAIHGDVLRSRRSTAMSARLDPEDMREVIRAYQDGCPARSRATTASSRSSWATGCWPISAPARARGRRRAGGASGPDIVEAVPSSKRAAKARVAGPRRHCHRHGRGGRLDRRGLGARAGRRRRDAQSGGAVASAGRAGQRRHLGIDAAAARRDVRAEGARAAGAQRASRRRFPRGRSCARPRTSAASRRRVRRR